jgi:branched-chain amino acid transport system substrate-binding protein
MLVAVSACGSKLDDAELRAANAIAFTSNGTGGSGGPGGTSGVGGTTGTAGLGGTGNATGGGTGIPGVGPTFGGSAGGVKSEIRLGSFGTHSGLIGAALRSAPVAIRAWAADVNRRGGVNGHPIRVILKDDGGEPARALVIAREMVERDEILAFFDLHGATTLGNVTPYINENHIPVIGSVQHTDADTSPNYFAPQQGGTKGVARGLLMALVAQADQRKVALLNASECGAACAQHTDIAARDAASYGVDIVYRADVSIAQPDYTATIIAARNAGANAIIAEVDYPTITRITRSAHRQNWFPVIVGNPSTYDPGFGGDEVDKTLAFATMAPYDISAQMKPYRDAVARYVPGGALGDFGAQMWAGGKLLEAIGPALDDNPTRPEIFSALYALRGETLGGIVPPLTYPKGAHANVNLCGVPLTYSSATERWSTRSPGVFFCMEDGGRVRRVGT